MNEKIEKINGQQADQSKDIKKIRSVIAKYRNKSTDMSNNSIEAKILRTLVNKGDNKENKLKLTEVDNKGVLFTSNSFMNYNENYLNTLQNNKTSENVVKLTERSGVNEHFNVDLNYESNKNESVELLSKVKQIMSSTSANANRDEVNIKENSSSTTLINNGLPNSGNHMPGLVKNHSMASNITLNSGIDNIKILNEFKNNIENKISSLKKKLINSSLSSHFIKIDYEKFHSLNLKNFYTILQFLDTNDLFHFVNINKTIKNKLVNLLIHYSKIIVGEFDKKYLRLFKCEEKILTFKKMKKNKRGHLKISLILKSKIISDTLKDKSVAIGNKCRFPCDKESLKNIYKFDVISPGPISFWIMREYTNFHQDELNKAYFQHIMQFCVGDYIETTMNIFTEKGMVDFSTFKWLTQNIQSIPNFNFLEFSNDHNKNREVLDFDLSRFCELEIVKNKWNDLSNMSNSDNILKKIKSLFEPNLIVQKVLYDDVGYFLFKIFLVANTKGSIPTSEELGINIEVLEVTQKLSNEVKKNCLIFDRKNELQCRIGDIIIFYISKNK